MSWVKVHILDSPEPLKEGQTRTANCGIVLPNSVWVFMWDTDSGGMISMNPDSLNCCRVCQKLKASGRYVYGLIPGQQAHDSTQENSL